MKKKGLILIAGVLVGILAVGCVKDKEETPQNTEPAETEEPQETANSVPVLQPTVNPDNEAVCYYGCPNSKRIKKLNLKKKFGS